MRLFKAMVRISQETYFLMPGDSYSKLLNCFCENAITKKLQAETQDNKQQFPENRNVNTQVKSNNWNLLGQSTPDISCCHVPKGRRKKNNQKPKPNTKKPHKKYTSAHVEVHAQKPHWNKNSTIPICSRNANTKIACFKSMMLAKTFNHFKSLLHH